MIYVLIVAFNKKQIIPKFNVQVNNYIVRSYRDVIVVANIVTRRTSKA